MRGNGDCASASQVTLNDIARWRHQMETFSALLALCAGNSPVPANSPHKGQWRGALMFPLICVWINDWVNNREAGDLRRHRGHYDVSVMDKTDLVQTTTKHNKTPAVCMMKCTSGNPLYFWQNDLIQLLLLLLMFVCVCVCVLIVDIKQCIVAGYRNHNIKGYKTFQ